MTILLSELHMHLLKPDLCCVHVTGQICSNITKNPCSIGVLFSSLCSEFRISSFINDAKHSYSNLLEMCVLIY